MSRDLFGIIVLVCWNFMLFAGALAWFRANSSLPPIQKILGAVAVCAVFDISLHLIAGQITRAAAHRRQAANANESDATQ